MTPELRITATLPRFYRYEADGPHRLRPVFGWNRYGTRRLVVGATLIVGRWAYCVKWARAFIRQTAG